MNWSESGPFDLIFTIRLDMSNSVREGVGIGYGRNVSVYVLRVHTLEALGTADLTLQVGVFCD